VRFLVDASLSPAVAVLLIEAGHDAVHVGDALGLKVPDLEVLEHAAADGRVIIAADTDFGELLARRGVNSPSLVLFRRRTGRRPANQASLLLEHLPDVRPQLEEGAVVVIEEGRIRVRQLPISQ
jgi:predicted nuclease of predicted toxin-antitoxin system